MRAGEEFGDHRRGPGSPLTAARGNLPRRHARLRGKGALDGAEVRDIGQTWSLIFAARKARDAAHA